MSPQRHREVNAKVAGRDPPKGAKETMTPFRSLMGQLLKVKPNELAEQQRRYDEARDERPLRVPKGARKLKPKHSLPLEGMNPPKDECR
jgi:hypothetical protein